MTRPRVLDDGLTRSQKAVLTAVLSGKRTVRDVAWHAYRSPARTHTVLCELRRMGLVEWDDDKHGTIHPVIRGEVS